MASVIHVDCPDAAAARCKLAEALFRLGDVDGAFAEFEHASGTDDAAIRAIALSNMACIAPGSFSCDNSGVLAVRRRAV